MVFSCLLREDVVIDFVVPENKMIYAALLFSQSYTMSFSLIVVQLHLHIGS